MIESAQDYLNTCELRHRAATKNRIGAMDDDRLRAKVVDAAKLVADARLQLFNLKKIAQREQQEKAQGKQRKAKDIADAKLEAARVALPGALKQLKQAINEVLSLERTLGGASAIEITLHEARSKK